MTSVILIAIRMKSTRLPKKAVRMLGEQTILEHLIDRLKKCKKVDEIVLCTSTHPDDQILLEYADKKGIKKFAGSEEDVLDRFMKAAESVGADVAVRVTGDNPLTDPEYIDKMIELQEQTGTEYVYTEGLVQGARSEVMTLDAMKKAHELAHDPTQSEYMTIYFRSGLFDIEKVVADESVTRDYRLTIDNPEDLELFEKITEKVGKNLANVSLVEILRFLDEKPELAKMNITAAERKVSKEIINTPEGTKIKIIIE